MGGILSEMIAHEKSLDFYIDLLRKDQLDENVTSEPLEKCFGYFTNLYPVHLQDEKINSNLFLQDEAKIAQAVCECIEVDVSRMKVVMQVICPLFCFLFSLFLLSFSYNKICAVIQRTQKTGFQHQWINMELLYYKFNYLLFYMHTYKFE